jgi:hypothetical protein
VSISIQVGQPMELEPGREIIGTAESYHTEDNYKHFWIDLRSDNHIVGYFMFEFGPGITVAGEPIHSVYDVLRLALHRFTDCGIKFTYPASQADYITQADFFLVENP